jgi:hypothetical protein
MRRAAVPGPYHAVARGVSDGDAAKMLAIIVALGSDEPMFMTKEALDVLIRVRQAYTNDLHVSGAPERVTTNDATVRAAVDALNRATR